MLDIIWIILILLSVGYGVATGNGNAISKAASDSVGQAVALCINLCGIYALWCGLMKVAEKGGLLKGLCKLLQPVIGWLYPSAKKDQPAKEAITLNMAANMLGLGNAATPAGQSAMKHLKRISGGEEASDDMVMLLAVNNSSLQIIPTTVIALRAAAGSASPGDIVLCAILSSVFATFTAIFASRFLAGKKKI